jgi:hypothetical protein
MNLRLANIASEDETRPSHPEADAKSYYEVPVEIIEDDHRLAAWAAAAIRCQRKKD